MAAGEESAELDKVLMQMSIYYSSEFDHYLDNLTSLLEPVLILFFRREGIIIRIPFNYFY
ncbi:MAG: hypothetical protein DYG97_16330 [Ignavibacteria bacterium CHB3]|nr:hypothetical protein [Ignavibacteria bacterium CHB3]